MKRRLAPIIALALALPLVGALVWLALPEGAPGARRVEPVGPTQEAPRGVVRTLDGGGFDGAAPPRRARTGEDEPTARIDATRAEPAAPVAGRLVDAASGDGLASWEVLVHARTGASNARDGWEWIETLSTDRDGRFRTAAAWPSGRFQLEPRLSSCPGLLRLAPPSGVGAPSADFSSPRTSSVFVTAHDPLRPIQARLAVPAGPRYRVLTVLPAGLDTCDFKVELALGSGAGVAGGALLEAEPFEASFEAPVRAPVEAGARWTLRLRSRDGRWAGAAPVESVVGTCASPVAIELVARATLRGRVVDAERQPVVGAALSWLPSLESSALEGEGAARADRYGEFVLEQLPSGAGTLRVEARGAPPLERELELAPHGDERVELQLDALRTGDVSGELEFAGELAHPPRLELREAGVGSAQAAKLEARAAGRVAFRFERVPLGDYELVVAPTDGARWEPERQRVRAPSSGHVIRRAAGESAMVVLDVLGAEDGAPLSGVFGLLSSGEELLRSERNPPGTLLLDGVQEHLAGTLVVGAPGREPRAVLLAQLRRNGRFLAGELRLAPGATSCVQVLEREGGRPLAGAIVRASSGPSAVTDRAGLAWLPVPRRGTSFTVALDGWTTDGAEGTADELLRVFLRPE